jgi:hypothetical protein
MSWAFLGVDLYRGRLQLVEPTIIQSAALAHNVNRSAVQWALQRENERTAIEAGVIPLVPKPVKMLPAPVSAKEKLAEAVAEVGGVDVAIDMICALPRCLITA